MTKNFMLYGASPSELLGNVDLTYQCVADSPAKLKSLKAKKYKLICEVMKVEGFSVGDSGNRESNGISLLVPLRVVGI